MSIGIENIHFKKYYLQDGYTKILVYIKFYNLVQKSIAMKKDMV